MTTMGVRLKKIREALHLKQSELGLLVKYDVNINYVLAGKGEMFNQEEFKKEDMNTWFRKMLDDELKRKGLIK